MTSVQELTSTIMTHVARVDEANSSHEWFLTVEAAGLADTLCRLAVSPEGAGPSGAFLALGLFGWCRLVASAGRDACAAGQAVFFLAPFYLNDTVKVPPPLRLAFAAIRGEPGGGETPPPLAHDLATGLHAFYQEFRFPGALPDAERLLHHAIDRLPEDDPLRGNCLSTLGMILTCEFGLRPQPEIMAAAVRAGRAAITAVSGNRAEQARRHSNLALTLAIQGAQDQDAAREAVAQARRAVGLSDVTDPLRAAYLANLGRSLTAMALNCDEAAALLEAAEFLRAGLSAMGTPAHGRAATLAQLGAALLGIATGLSRPEALAEAVSVYRQAVASSADADRPVCLVNLGYALLGQAQQTSGAGISPNTGQSRPEALIGEAVALAGRARDLAPSGHPWRGHILNLLSEIEEAWFEASGSTDDLSAAIATTREAADLVPPDTGQSARLVGRLADLLRQQAKLTSRREPLSEAEELLRATISRAQDGSARAVLLLALGRVLESAHVELQAAESALRECLTLPVPERDRTFPARARHALGQVLVRDASRWEEGVDFIRVSVELLPAATALRADYLSNLGGVYLARAKATGDPGLHDQAVQTLRAAVAACAADRKQLAACQSNLGAALAAYGTLTGDAGLLAEAARTHRQAVAATPASDSYRPLRLGNLGNALQRLAERESDIGLLEEAVSVLREAVAATPEHHPARSTALTQMASALCSLTRATGNPIHVSEAAGLHRQALALPPGNGVTRASQVNNLCTALESLCQYTGDDFLRAEVDSLLTAELSAGTHSLEERAGLLGNRGLTRWYRATAAGEGESLRSAVEDLRESAATLPEGHDNKSISLLTLGGALMARSDMTGEPAWLAEAVEVLRQAVAQCPQRSMYRVAAMSNLGTALRRAHHATGDRSALAEAVAAQREAASLDYGDRLAQDLALVNLGVLYLDMTAEDASDHAADQAIETLERALARLDDDHPWRGFALANLAVACLMRVMDGNGGWLFGQTLSPGTDLTFADRAAAAAREALGCGATNQADMARGQWVLAFAHLLKHSHGQPADLPEAIKLSKDGATNEAAPTDIRLRAARAWGDAAAAAGQDAEALEGYSYAVSLLPLVAPRSLSQMAGAKRLESSFGLACDAAAFALRAADPERALALLEQGRGVLIGRGLDTRDDLSQLRGARPEYAAAFERIRDALTADTAPLAPPAGGSGAGLTLRNRQQDSQRAEARQARARELEALLAQIRTLPGQEEFLRPPGAAELRTAAAEAPVVVVNVSRHQCDAILITGSGIEVVGLDEVSAERALDAAVLSATTLSEAFETKHAGQAASATWPVPDVFHWLWRAIAEPVMSHLGYRRTPGENEPWPRLFWCPTGWLSFLPVHAAADAETGDSVLDRVISSYIPTVRTLIRARKAANYEARPVRLLVVSVPNAPEAPPLPGTEQETEIIKRIFPTATVLTGHEATVEAVLAALPHHSWVHFGCHGVTDPLIPAASGLMLHDGRLRATNVASSRLATGDLAVLAACSTAQASLTLPDEPVHVASAFQLAGFRHVIATLWPIPDKLAAKLTEDLYTRLRANACSVRTADPATVLHHYARRLKNRLPYPLWAAYIHIGL